MATVSSDWTMQGLDNPSVIQNKLLSRLEDEAGIVVVDNNNPASILMEGFADITASAIRMIDDNVRPAIYPARAVTVADLFKHLSDNDYVNMISAPASTTILMIVDKNYILTHSVDVPLLDDDGNVTYNDDGTVVTRNYKKVVIPKSTTFTVGSHSFGLYYPIEIRSNQSTGKFSVVYDTTEENPLKSLETNVLDFDFHEYNGHHLAYIKIPVYQFSIVSTDVVLVDGSGYKQEVEYTNKFYALRCYAEVLQNFGHDTTEEDVFERQELSLAISGQTYDPKTPTIIFTPDDTNGTCLIEIPYVYFSEGRLRGTLRIDIYTTEGELNYQVPTDSTESCTIDMFSNIATDEESTYATPFKTMPALKIIPYATEVVGGSNGLTFDELRERVIKGVNTTVLQTPSDIDAYFAAYGYTTTLLRDGITDRIFIVHSEVKDTNDDIVGCDTISTLFDFRDVDNISTIVQPESGGTTYTILPSTLYLLDSDKKTCSPITDVQRRAIESLSSSDKVETMNENVYTLSPFHLQIDATSRYPTTITYDMMDKEVQSRIFVASRSDDKITGELAINSVNFDIVHGSIKDDYQLTFRISKINLDGMSAIVGSNENIRVLVGFKNDDGEFYYGRALWEKEEDGYDIFRLLITPTYIFKQANNDHTVQFCFWNNNKMSDTLTGKEISDFFLTSEARVILLMNKSVLNLGDYTDNTATGVDYLDTDFTKSTYIDPSGIQKIPMTGFTAVSEYKLVVRFGSPVDELDQRINLTYSEATYKKHKTTKFRTLETDQYERDSNGELIVDYVYSKPDEDSYLNRDITYYEKNDDDEYVVVTFDSSWYNTKKVSECGKTIYIRTVVPTIKVEYPAGTLRCLTRTDEDGYQLVPRFNINAADSSKSDIVVGRYDLDVSDEETKKRPLSSMTNTWFQGEAADGKEHAITTINALRYILDPDNNVVVEIESPDDTEPLNNLPYSYDTGTYLFVNDDTSELEKLDGYTSCQLGTVENESESILEERGYGRLYYKFRSLTSDEETAGTKESTTWRCIAQAHYCNPGGTTILARDNMYNKILAEDPEVTGTDADADLVRRYYGFAYLLTIDSKDHYFAPLETETYRDYDIPLFMSRSIEAWENRELYVETTDEVFCGHSDPEKPTKVVKEYYFINTKGEYTRIEESTYKDGDPIGIPEKYAGQYTDATVYFKQTVDVIEEEYGWETHANRWPWDVPLWQMIDEVVLTNEEEEIARYNSIAKDYSFDISFDYNRLTRYVEYSTNQVILNESGEPIEDEDETRSIQYLVDMLQLDAKHIYVTSNTDTDGTPLYPEKVTSTLRTHFDNVGHARDTMFTNTRLFFEPIKSLGYGTFNVGNNITKEYPLDISMSFKLHVTQSAYEDEIVEDTIRNQIIDIVDDHIKNGYVSCAEIASTIIEKLSDSVRYVDVLGINGDTTLQTMKCVDSDVRPHLKHTLVLLEDGVTIDSGRGLNLEIVMND